MDIESRQAWRCSCLGHRGSGSTRCSGELAVRVAGNAVLPKGTSTSMGQYAPVFLPVEAPSATEKPGRPQSTVSQRSGSYRSNHVHTDIGLVLACGSSAPVRVGHEGGAAS